MSYIGIDNWNTKYKFNYFIAKLSSLLYLYNSNTKSVREIVNGRQMWANDLDQKSWENGKQNWNSLKKMDGIPGENGRQNWKKIRMKKSEVYKPEQASLRLKKLLRF